MPNQLNFPDPIPTPYIAERPERLSTVDRNISQVGTKQVVFGTTERDHAELWIYDSNGSIAGHINLFPTDDALSLTTLVDNTGAYEMLNIDMGKAVRLMSIESGRYGFVANYFRDEVGSEVGDRLYIADISNDRTELRLYPKNINDRILREIYEWVVPSVPKVEAQGLIDQTFAQSVDFSDADALNTNRITVELDQLINGTSSRIEYSGASLNYEQMISKVINLAGPRALGKMAADTANRNIQDADLQNYIREATGEVIRELRDSGELDPRFEVF
jgi:hypothetical protein